MKLHHERVSFILIIYLFIYNLFVYLFFYFFIYLFIAWLARKYDIKVCLNLM